MPRSEYDAQELANKEIVERFLQAMTQGDVNGLDACMSEDSSYWIGAVDLPGTLPGSDFARRLQRFFALSADGKIDIKAVAFTIDGDRLAVEAESTAALKNGDVYRNVYHFVFVCRDGKIVELREYLDIKATDILFNDRARSGTP
ncbi:nuclear transport factor 2 family protein [Rhodococcus pseudokoreensis]|uniref:Nuclear transport factor 2 family protein n=1 Tax=Rhodococcus pseudokoreensis TaxID=2811421 RepID=A0A974W3T1_9NOCA|nr:nuclear transport factor 2 family protein [Rhodococcus pseudokoreensis]QSE90780.1 nuclear transport factor 2 family protein [Rhodococcus pseudokoreensis]